MEVQAVACKAGGGFDVPKGEEGAQPMHFRQAALHHPTLGIPSTAAVPGTFFFKAKKAKCWGMLALPALCKLPSGIAFLDFCVCNSLAALSRVP